MALGDYVLLCDKPAGTTSHDVVAAVRRALPRKTRVGHAGTLDPFATGLLLVLVGRATRVQRFLMALPKRYEVTARFGAVSSTGDPEGEIVETGRVPQGPLALPTGVLRQRPPAFSAVKVGGRRAYQLARAGVSVELGEAYCQSLRRTRIGRFDVADADPSRPLPLSEALDFLPEVNLDAEAARRASHGQTVTAPTDAAPTVRLTDADGLVALAQPAPDGSGLRPVVGFR